MTICSRNGAELEATADELRKQADHSASLAANRADQLVLEIFGTDIKSQAAYLPQTI